MSEDNVKKMAKLLREGATMLNLYCPQCNGILFRNKKADIFCPNCNKTVIINSAEKTNTQLEMNRNSNSPEKSDLESQLNRLVQKLANKLEIEDDLLIIERVLQILKQALEIISLLKNV